MKVVVLVVGVIGVSTAVAMLRRLPIICRSPFAGFLSSSGVTLVTFFWAGPGRQAEY